MKTQLKKDEKVALIIRKHWLILLKPILWTLLLLIIAIVAYYYTRDNFEYSYIFIIGALLISIWFVYKVFERKANLWAVTNLRVIDEYGVFSNNSKETPLDKINNVSFHQSFIGRIFNYGDVQIQSAAESGSTIHRMVEKPRDLKDTITESQKLYQEQQILEQAKKLANAVGTENHSSKIDISEELIKLHDLKEKGIITEEDFRKRKNKILNI